MVSMTLKAWYQESFCSVIQFEVWNRFPPIESHGQLVEVYDDCIIKVQHMRE